MKKLLFVSLLSLCFLSFGRSANANRLTDPNYNRCAGDAAIPPEQCEQYQEFAWNGGDGCITFEEYLYARQNFIAPICNQFDRHQYLGYCRCGCLARETQVFVEQDKVLKWVAIDSLPGHEAESKLLTLAEQATMTTWDYLTPGLMAMTIGPEKNPLVWVKTTTGLTIGLTETHGVLLSNGFMAKAVELKPGDVLVNMSGAPEVIASIERKQTTDDVFNVLTDAGTKNKAGHIIFANELAVGDLYWQNILESEFRKLVIRE
jgi:hypothetical protein